MPYQITAMMTKYPIMRQAIDHLKSINAGGEPVFRFLYKYPNNDSIMFAVDVLQARDYFILTPTGILYVREDEVNGIDRPQMKTGINSLKDAFIPFIGYNIAISAVYMNGDIAIKDDEGKEYILASSGNIYGQAFVPNNVQEEYETVDETARKYAQNAYRAYDERPPTLDINELKTHVRLRNLHDTFIWAVFIDGVLRNWGFEAEGPAFGDASINFDREILNSANIGHNVITTVYKVDGAGNINEMLDGYHSGTGNG